MPLTGLDAKHLQAQARHSVADIANVARPNPESPAAKDKAPFATPVPSKERRRRKRRQYRRPGWVYRGQEVSQVQMRNVSGDGAGFVSDLAVKKGERLHLKAGMGATRRPRLAEVMFVRERVDGRHEVGVRFIRGVSQQQ